MRAILPDANRDELDSLIAAAARLGLTEIRAESWLFVEFSRPDPVAYSPAWWASIRAGDRIQAGARVALYTSPGVPLLRNGAAVFVTDRRPMDVYKVADGGVWIAVTRNLGLWCLARECTGIIPG